MIVAGYMANLATCTPGWCQVCVALNNASQRAYLSFAKRMKEKHGGDPHLPVEAIEAIERGEIEIDTDADFIQAILTRNLMDHAWHAYHQDWTIIRNESDYPFVTSDNPVALQEDPNGRELLARYLTITPTLSLAVACTRRRVPAFDPSLPAEGTIRWATAAKDSVKLINKLVVQCAESLVFSPEHSSSTARLVRNNARHRVDGDFLEVPAATPNAIYHAAVLRIREFQTNTRDK